MAEKAVSNGKVYLDPMFYIPEGAEELVYEDESQSREPTLEEFEDGSLLNEGYGIGEAYDDNYDLVPDGPGTPFIDGIISQTIRRTPGGQQVVDVVLEVSDVQGVADYEFRVTKI